jgi:hypothetical protein
MNLLNTGIADISFYVSEVVDNTSSFLTSSNSLPGQASILLNIIPVRGPPVVHVPGEVFFYFLILQHEIIYTIVCTKSKPLSSTQAQSKKLSN